MNVEPDVTLGEIEIGVVRVVDDCHTNNACDDDEATETEDKVQKIFLGHGEL